MARALGWRAVAALSLCLAGSVSEAADAPHRERSRRHAAARTRPYHPPAYPAIGLACDEGWGDTVILRCPPDQIRVRPADDDLDAWNALTGLEAAQHRPYRQLFTWSR